MRLLILFSMTFLTITSCANFLGSEYNVARIKFEIDHKCPVPQQEGHLLESRYSYSRHFVRGCGKSVLYRCTKNKETDILECKDENEITKEMEKK